MALKVSMRVLLTPESWPRGEGAESPALPCGYHSTAVPTRHLPEPLAGVSQQGAERGRHFHVAAKGPPSPSTKFSTLEKLCDVPRALRSQAEAGGCRARPSPAVSNPGWCFGAFGADQWVWHQILHAGSLPLPAALLQGALSSGHPVHGTVSGTLLVRAYSSSLGAVLCRG